MHDTQISIIIVFWEQWRIDVDIAAGLVFWCFLETGFSGWSFPWDPDITDKM
jgi:hypothetical protein